MSRRPSRRTVLLRECLVTALREATEPPSTDELRQVPPDHLLPWRKGPLVYQQLRALERMGICRRVPWDRAHRRIVDPKHVYWTFTHDDTFAAVIAELDPGSEHG